MRMLPAAGWCSWRGSPARGLLSVRWLCFFFCCCCFCGPTGLVATWSLGQTRQTQQTTVSYQLWCGTAATGLRPAGLRRRSWGCQTLRRAAAHFAFRRAVASSALPLDEKKRDDCVMKQRGWRALPRAPGRSTQSRSCTYGVSLCLGLWLGLRLRILLWNKYWPSLLLCAHCIPIPGGVQGFLEPHGWL